MRIRAFFMITALLAFPLQASSASTAASPRLPPSRPAEAPSHPAPNALAPAEEAMSGRLEMNKCRLTSLIRVSYLAPDIVRALLEGRQPIELTPTRLLRLSKDLPHDWSEQRHVLGFAVHQNPAESL